MSRFRHALPPCRARAVRALLALGVAAGLARAGAAAAQGTNAALPHPRLGMYAGATAAGFPFIKADQTIDQALLDSVARFDAVILPVSPFTEYQPQVLQGLRARHPSIKLYAY